MQTQLLVLPYLQYRYKTRHDPITYSGVAALAAASLMSTPPQGPTGRDHPLRPGCLGRMINKYVSIYVPCGKLHVTFAKVPP